MDMDHIRKCQTCGRLFQSARAARYCSDACRQKAYRRRADPDVGSVSRLRSTRRQAARTRQGQSISTTCTLCGRQFWRSGAEASRLYCGDACKQRAYRLRRREERDAAMQAAAPPPPFAPHAPEAQETIPDAPGRSTNGTQRLQALVDQIPALAGAAVEYDRGNGYYVRGAGETLFFERLNIGRRWLQRWIDSGEKPAMAALRIGAN